MTAESILKHHIRVTADKSSDIPTVSASESLFDGSAQETFDRAYWKFVTEYVEDPERGVSDLDTIRVMDDMSLKMGEQLKLDLALQAACDDAIEDMQERLNTIASTGGLDAYREEISSIKEFGTTSVLEYVYVSKSSERQEAKQEEKQEEKNKKENNMIKKKKKKEKSKNR